MKEKLKDGPPNPFQETAERIAAATEVHSSPVK
jgi:hypothetical protein